MSQIAPAKVLVIHLTSLTPTELYGQEPYPNQPWRFRGTFNVDPQYHSDPSTQTPNIFNGLDVTVGDYITTQGNKVLVIKNH